MHLNIRFWDRLLLNHVICIHLAIGLSDEEHECSLSGYSRRIDGGRRARGFDQGQEPR